jgi:hypothetical protein
MLHEQHRGIRGPTKTLVSLTPIIGGESNTIRS